MPKTFEYTVVSEGSLEVKLPTIWTDGNAKMGRTTEERSSERRKSEERRSDREKIRREKMQVREKVGKSPKTLFFQCFVVPEGRQVGSLKQRVRRHLGR